MNLSKLALLICHNTWHESSQRTWMGVSTIHRPALIYMNLAHNVFVTDILFVAGVGIFFGVLHLQIKVCVFVCLFSG
jgi:hypothetical protein